MCRHPVLRCETFFRDSCREHGNEKLKTIFIYSKIEKVFLLGDCSEQCDVKAGGPSDLCSTPAVWDGVKKVSLFRLGLLSG